MRIVFAGTPEIAAIVFKKLLGTQHEIVGVYTQPDRPAGRGRELQASPVKQLALAHHIPIYQPLTLRKEEAQAELASLKPDLMIVVAYGLILPQVVLDIPKYGCWNVHVSLLPRWRGAAPIQRSIEAGDTETGVTIMQMDAGLDTGDMLKVVKCPILNTDTSAILHDRLADLGAEALLFCLNLLANNQLTKTPQPSEGVTYAHKLSKEEANVDWQQSAKILAGKIQAFNPWPVAQSNLDGQVVRIWQAQAQDPICQKTPGTIIALHKDSIEVAASSGSVKITQLQFPGGKVLAVRDILNGKNHPLVVGKQFA